MTTTRRQSASPRGALAAVFAAVLAALVLSGCSSGRFLGMPVGGDPEPEGTGPSGIPQAGDLTIYLEAMRDVIEGDSLTQAEMLRQLEESADIAPTTTNRLLYALVLGLPGHPGSDPAEASRRLATLLASGDALLPAERMLATVQLSDVEQRIILETAARELRAELTAESQSSDAASQQRIQALLDENRRLQLALEDATSKLDAITSIEQSIRELEDGSD